MALRRLCLLGRSPSASRLPLIQHFNFSPPILGHSSSWIPPRRSSSQRTLVRPIVPPLSQSLTFGNTILFCGLPSFESPPPPLICSYRDDLRREQFNRIVGKIGIRKKDAGIYWNQYKIKRIKIRKKKRVI